MNTHRRWVGLGLISFPLLLQVPFTMLTATFDYPAILEREASEVLPRFAGGVSLTWLLYALCVVPFIAVATAAPGVIAPRSRRLMPIARTFGAITATTQLIGLLRWTFVVPVLARMYVDSPEARPMISIAYVVQHRLFGAMLGEFVGQLTLAVWTGLISSVIASAWLKRLGYFTAAAFLLGLGHEAHPALRHLPMIAFIAWSVFAVWLGASLTRRNKGDRLV